MRADSLLMPLIEALIKGVIREEISITGPKLTKTKSQFCITQLKSAGSYERRF
ncbi:MAG: hypothetical protein ACI8XX_002157 [Polaribacter sp.]|jgi:hypothetical protein